MGSRWRPITTSGFVRHLENVQITLFIFLHSRLAIFQRWHSRNITSMNLYRCFTGVHCWIVGKPVSWTLDADLPRKTGSRYNDTLNGVRKPKGSATMSRKLTVLTHCLVGNFRLKLHWGVKIPPVAAGTRVKEAWLWLKTTVLCIYALWFTKRTSFMIVPGNGSQWLRTLFLFLLLGSCCYQIFVPDFQVKS